MAKSHCTIDIIIERLVFMENAHLLLGLTDEEFDLIKTKLTREPNDLELAMYSVMWSEHCSYKSSRVHLGRLPSESPLVLVGPGENAGVIDVGDNLAIALRIESHNHPSAIEPYQGAATGAGGIIRDIFTMGARPIALMDPLFTGPVENAHNAYLLDGIVRGISGYGNSVGVPTVGGSITFDTCYNQNPLVNVFCLGILPKDRLVLGRASGEGNLVVLLGSATGRDGIGGVSILASAGFGQENPKAVTNSQTPAHDETSSKRPSVQVGDPYEEKRLIEATLALLDAHLAVAIQDLGGAGLACATSELAARGRVAMDVYLSCIPLREDGMTPPEIMTSESQERMLAIVKPEDFDEVKSLCDKFEINSSIIGHIVPDSPDCPSRLRILSEPGGTVLADMPAATLADEAPKYHRPITPPKAMARLSDFITPVSTDAETTPVSHFEGSEKNGLRSGDEIAEDILSLLLDPSFIYEQYDYQLFTNTICAPGEADAAVLKLSAPDIEFTGKAVSLSTDANPKYCAIDPKAGTALTVAESALNVACTGAKPIGLVNCLNFGNPEHGEVMWQLSESIDGMAKACTELEIPVVGGNVSLYNASEGKDILPTPVVAVVGLIEHITTKPPAIGLDPGESLVLLGTTEETLCGSSWAELHKHDWDTRHECRLPKLDLGYHKKFISFIADLVGKQISEDIQGKELSKPKNFDTGDNLVGHIHDVSAGGLATTLCEMVIKSQCGALITGIQSEAELFSESPSRVVVATKYPALIGELADGSGIAHKILGSVDGDRLIIENMVDIDLADIKSSYTNYLPAHLEITDNE